MGWVSIRQIFTSKGTSPNNHFCTTYNFIADSFHTQNFVADILQGTAILNVKRPFCVFDPFGRGVGATYDVHLRLIGKRVVDFQCSLNFFSRFYG